jgi:hypothetical protein
MFMDLGSLAFNFLPRSESSTNIHFTPKRSVNLENISGLNIQKYATIGIAG